MWLTQSCLWREGRRPSCSCSSRKRFCHTGTQTLLRVDELHGQGSTHLQKDVVEVNVAPRPRAAVENLRAPPLVHARVKAKVPARLRRQAHLKAATMTSTQPRHSVQGKETKLPAHGRPLEISDSEIAHPHNMAMCLTECAVTLCAQRDRSS